MEETKIKKMNDGRLLGAIDHVIFPMLKKMIEDRISLACSNFSAGKTDFVGDVAYIHGIKTIEQQLKRLQTDGNQIAADLNKL